MKNLFLVLTLITLPIFIQAQDRQTANEIRTPAILKKGTYSLIESQYFDPFRHRPVRVTDDGHLIVKLLHDENDPKVYGHTPLQKNWKLSDNILSRKIGRKSSNLYAIRYSGEFPPDELIKSHESQLIRVIDNSKLAIIRSSFKFISDEVLPIPDVEFIDILDKNPKEESPLRQYLPELNRINIAKRNYPDLSGDGMIISLKERSIDESDIDLGGKIILDEHSSTEFTQHAKEMGTLIAGYGNSFKTGKGISPEASIVCTDFNSLLAEDITYYNNYDIMVQNHSYGTGIENYYGVESVTYDQISSDKLELMHVFSAGNMGMATPESGPYAGIQGYATLTGSYKQSKNCLVIGAVDSIASYVAVSSSGPAYDGRIKPELVAFGGEGSSESAALASGSIALIQELFIKKYNRAPASSLVKGLLIAGSDDVHESGIDFKTGYGMINLNKSLQVVDAGNFLEGEMGSNETQNIIIQVPENAAEMKLVLSWIDPPANPEDFIALVNDLDMKLNGPDNVVYYPWILDHSPNEDALSSLPKRGEDHLNNVEMVSVDKPKPGSYSIELTSTNLLGEFQNFSLAYHFDMNNSFTWTFPTAIDRVEKNRTNLLRWDCEIDEEFGQISIKYGTGEWEEIGQSTLSDKYFKFQFPDITAVAQLKMTIGNQFFLSDTFSISGIPKISVENDCEDEFVLSWSRANNVVNYNVFELAGNQLSPVLTTADTLIRLQKTLQKVEYYAVEPAISDAYPGIRSYATNYTASHKGCYINQFLAFLDIDQFANIQLTVNVPDDINEIEIIKHHENKYEVFKQIQPVDGKVFMFQDTDLTPGRYSYFAELALKDGDKIYSDTLSVYYTDDKTVIVFPNPAKDDFVNILNNYPGGTLQLIDEKGIFVKEYDLVNVIDEIELTGLPNGLYLFRIFYENRIVNSGKIIRL